MDIFLDKNSNIDILVGGNLPHWHQEDKLQFVTFRLADSLPTTVIQHLNEAILAFKSQHPEPWDSDTKRKYWNIVGPMEERLLNNGHGDCTLKYAHIRKIVSDAIKYHAGVRYDIFAYVIMPNHVHMLIRTYSTATLSQILHSIKRFTANKINKLTQHSGKFWMPESFDRIVRSMEDMKHYVRYIQQNPAHLPSDEFELYINEKISVLKGLFE